MSAFNQLLLSLRCPWVSITDWAQMEHTLFGSSDGADLSYDRLSDRSPLENIDIAIRVDQFPHRLEIGYRWVAEAEKYLKDKYYSTEDRPINGTLVKVENGIIIKALKGTLDETNNSIFYSYSQHVQLFSSFITKPVKRNIPTALQRALRGILSTFCRKNKVVYHGKTRKGKTLIIRLRQHVKKVLREGNLGERLECLKSLSFYNFEDDYDINHLVNIRNHLKIAASQMAQKIALHHGFELYCKKEYSERFPDLKSLLYRESDLLSEITLEKYRLQFIDIMEGYIESGSLKLIDTELNSCTWVSS